MFKTFGIAALVAVVALVVGFGGRGSSTPTAQADTTSVVVVPCELIAAGLEAHRPSPPTPIDIANDTLAACGGPAAPFVQLPPGTVNDVPGARTMVGLAKSIGNEDGVLTASDLTPLAALGANQLSTDCTLPGPSLFTIRWGSTCTLDVFVFTNGESPVQLQLPAGLKSLESPTTQDFLCSKEATVPLSVPITTSVAPGVITGASNTIPIVITTTAPTTGMALTDTVVVSGVTGNTAANGTWAITAFTATTITLAASGGNGAYISGGVWAATTGALAVTPLTFTTSAAHGLAVGDVVTITGHSVAAANSTAGFTVATVPSSTTFTLTGYTTAIGGTGGTGGTLASVMAAANPTLGLDNDCSGGPPTGFPNNGDGVVLFHVINGNASAGEVKTITVLQNGVPQMADINVVGPPIGITLSLAKSTVETNGNTANVTACQKQTPAGLAAITQPTSTLAIAAVTDSGKRPLTRVPVAFKVTPPEDTEIAKIGLGDMFEEIVSNTLITVHPPTAGAATAAYAVVCAGKQSGKATIDASINGISCTITGCVALSSANHDSQVLTVTGAPSSNVLTADASAIKCDGSATSTVTAKVTDSAGNNVADGVPVNFSVVALGTANPINTVTKDGKASSVITPLSNSSAGVTVIVTAGDASIAPVVQTPVRVDCALPLATQPQAPAPVPTPRGGIAGPDTGNGGYLGQNSSNSFPMWAVLALVLGSVTLVAGGLVTRRAGK